MRSEGSCKTRFIVEKSHLTESTAFEECANEKETAEKTLAIRLMNQMF